MCLFSSDINLLKEETWTQQFSVKDIEHPLVVKNYLVKFFLQYKYSKLGYQI